MAATGGCPGVARAAPPTPADASVWRWQLAAFLGAAALVFARSANAFVYPFLMGEDASEQVLFFLRGGEPADVFRAYRGYAAVTPNAVGGLLSQLPLSWQPYGFAAAAGVVSALCLSLFSSARFAWLVPSVRCRAALCWALAAMPFGNFAVDACVMWMPWNLVFAAALLTIGRAPRTRIEAVVDTALVGVCIASNPTSVVLLPLWCLRAWRPDIPCAGGPRLGPGRAHYAAAALLTVLYQVALVDHSAASSRSLASALADGMWQLVVRVLAEPAIGLEGRLVLREHYLEGIAPAFALLLPSAVGLALARRRARGATAWALAFLAVFVVGSTLAIAFGRHHEIEHAHVSGQRYVCGQQRCAYLAACLALLALLRAHPPRVRALAAGALALHAAVLAWQNREYFATERERGERMLRFLSEIESWERAGGGSQESAVLEEPQRRFEVARPRPPR